MSIITAAAAAAVALSAQTGAHADPTPTKDEVKTQVDQLNEQAEVATEKFNAATEKQQTLQKQVSGLQDQVARQQAEVTTLQSTLGEIAAEQYRTGGISPTVQLMLSSSPDAFLGQADSLSQLGTSQADTLKTLKGEQSKLDQQKSEAQNKLADLEKTTQELKTGKDEIQAKLASAQALLDTLSRKEQDELRAAEAKAAAESATKAAAATPKADDRASRSETRTDLSGLPAGSYAATVIAAAEAQIGKPYGWGATGPNSFDCSGLMVWAFDKAGISLPRTSQSQMGAGQNIGTNIADAKPGDLIIYSGGGHVGLYVGNGQIVHAPHTGALVRHESATVMSITRIVRV
ncbi:cell wall-associated NlpC family hydrolase [Kitasatospora gansuensis]|uniref:Cell wall-associated NlpC family hydrolase n=1 Tax=Kitasatospora gansuensis TaxID=258050 RepID=A0A7W7SGA1_9ACTN|nr:cell wall-associated NlpC family hydrolase [Kitasatospora gansuensis]